MSMYKSKNVEGETIVVRAEGDRILTYIVPPVTALHIRARGQRDCGDCGDVIENGAECIYIYNDNEILCLRCGNLYLNWFYS